MTVLRFTVDVMEFVVVLLGFADDTWVVGAAVVVVLVVVVVLDGVVEEAGATCWPELS